METEQDYCGKCGNTGKLLNGKTCSCQSNPDFIGFEEKVCMFIPEQYRASYFDVLNVPSLTQPYYATKLNELHKDIVSLDYKGKNVFICSPPKTSKTVFAYSTMQKLFNKGINVVPLFDVLELRRIMHDVDYGKSYLYKDEVDFKVDDFYTVPYLFVKIPPDLSSGVCDTIYQITDRRTRRGNTTIFLSHISWSKIAEYDRNNYFKSLLGDGSFGTIQNNNFW